MRVIAGFALVFMALANVARADELVIAAPEVIGAEARHKPDLEGPLPGTLRGIHIWRAPSTPETGLLPTLYMADGAPGVYVIAARLRAAIEAGLVPPIQIVGMEPDLRHRDVEYGQPGRAAFVAHERWVLNVVIPWVERAARGSPTQRAIGGYSNGADFALAMGAAHPDVFAAVIAHSPLISLDLHIGTPDHARVRWALSAGLAEYDGLPQWVVGVARAEAHEAGADVRSCVGPWLHNGQSWIDLSPSAVAWAFGFPIDRIETPLERQSCRVMAAR
ncbi:MAG: alpha/beta hydrolase-fold protein [Vitreimonas sp.]